MQKKKSHQYVPANDLIWGAWGGVACAGIALVAEFAGEPLPQSVWGAGMGGFFWLWAVANVRNWLASRPLR